MGAVIVCGAITALLCFFFGFAPWVAAVAAVPWILGGVFVHFTGHRAFNTRANTDLTIFVAGFAVTLAITVPKFLAQWRSG
ncbi:MAG: hypothetical protein JNM17_31310 [Archangium sp.]|nr:hypothetical protein [Archangium sp.]